MASRWRRGKKKVKEKIPPRDIEDNGFSGKQKRKKDKLAPHQG